MVTRRELFRLFASPRLAQRMIATGWITAVRQGGPGRETLFDYKTTITAYERLRRGEQPPRLPCEIRRRKS